MKRLLICLILLLSVCMLFGCNKNTDATAEVAVYYNLDKGAEVTAENGVYSLNFLHNGETKTYKVTDEALLETILTQEFLGLQLEGDKITGITTMTWMPYKRLAWDYYVQSTNKELIKLNSYQTYNGEELMLKLEAGTVCYDVSPLSTAPGSVTEPMKNDRVSVIADMDDNIKYIFVTDRPAMLGTEKSPCQHCESDVYWYEWLSDNTVPTGDGHFKLTKDVNLEGAAVLSTGKLCLDLNGKTVTQTTFATALYTSRGGTFSIMDSVGGGKLIPSRADKDEDGHNNGMAIVSDSVESIINLYGGTYDGSKSNSRCGTVIQSPGTINMYGGEIIGGDCYGNGGGALRCSGTFNMYGGRIVGGRHYDTDYLCSFIRGGGALRIFGAFNMSGGIIEGGDSWCYGGGVLLAQNAKMNMTGGTITGCKAPQGGGIFATDYATISLSGNVKITGNEGGNLWLDANAKLFIDSAGLGEEAEIGLSMTTNGLFVENTLADVQAHFTSDNSAQKIVSAGNGNWELK